MCVCVRVSVCLHLAAYFPQRGEKGSEISALKKEFRMLGTLRSDICVNPGEMWWNVSTAHALDACASVCVCGECVRECVRVCMRRPSVFKACVLRGAGGRGGGEILGWTTGGAPGSLCVSVCVCVFTRASRAAPPPWSASWWPATVAADDPPPSATLTAHAEWPTA